MSGKHDEHDEHESRPTKYVHATMTHATFHGFAGLKTPDVVDRPHGELTMQVPVEVAEHLVTSLQAALSGKVYPPLDKPTIKKS